MTRALAVGLKSNGNDDRHNYSDNGPDELVFLVG